MTARPLHRVARSGLWLLIAVVTLGVAGAGARVEALIPTATPRTADWTMMLYAVGDTVNVAEVMVQNLNRLTTIPDSQNANIVALVDLPDRSDRGAPKSQIRGIGEFTTAKLMVLHGGRWNEIRDLGEQDMGRPDVLAHFIAEAADRFPAHKYGLTLFDHGGGYQGGYIDTGPPSTDAMSVAEIRDGTAAGLQAAGIPRLELLYHAACLMSSYETVSALAPLARTMAGSEEIMINTPILPEGYALMGSGASGQQVAKGLADGYGRFLTDHDTTSHDNARALMAMSVVDGDRIRALDLTLEAFARAAQAHAPEVAPAVARARARALEFVIALDPDSGSQDLVDLGDFLRNLGPLPRDVSIARDAVFGAIRSAVRYQVTGRGTEQATGLNVFLPTRADHVGTYLGDGTAPRGWGAFMASFLGSVATAADGSADAQFVNRRPQLELLPKGARVTGRLRAGDGARAVTARTQVLADIGGFKDALTLIAPGYLGAGGPDQVQGVWSYDSLVLTDGQSTIPFSAAFKSQVGGLVGSAYAKYTSPAGDRADVAFRLLLDSAGEIRAMTLSAVADDGTSAGVRIEPGGTLRPVIAVQTPSGFDSRVADQALRVGSGLRVDFARVRSGTPFTVGLVVGDVADQRDVAFASNRVP